MTEPVLRLAICTGRPAEAVEESLRSLARAGELTEPLIVTSGLDPEERRRHEALTHEVLPDATVLHEPRPGLSRARNRALEACEDDEVICFVDDDAVLGPGWLHMMERAWREADERVACIGGPIRARFVDPRPPWLTPTLLRSLSILDFGEQAVDLDPRRQALYGANVSFRCGRLREVRGFDPDLGAGTPMAVGEDDEAQLELARAGWLVRYDPGPFVWHLISSARLTPAEMVRRRARYGVFLGRRGRRRRRLAARRCLSSGRHLAASALRRDLAGATEWAANLGENAGVLAGPLLKRPAQDDGTSRPAAARVRRAGPRTSRSSSPESSAVHAKNAR